MQNTITEEIIELARGVFIENCDGESIFTTKTPETWVDFNKIFSQFDIGESSQSEQLFVRYYKETQPQQYEKYLELKEKNNEFDQQELTNWLISIHGIQNHLTFLLETQYKMAKSAESDTLVGRSFVIGLLIALFTTIFYFLPVFSVVSLAMLSPTMFLNAIASESKDIFVQRMIETLAWVGGSVYMAFVGPKLLSALVASSGFCHGMAIFSYVSYGISACLLVCGLLNFMLGITSNKNKFFEEQIAPALKSELSKLQNEQITDEKGLYNGLVSP